ncbi:DNA-binding protein [Christiangramia fulva]|uniref:DNA-binding protein n=1 Tax=Christiangramia fulva TaxID=2126553 RepID=A0A2R3Z667_9FLAO|nr:helix-hairpin-helix domain-containing protein [Christiangramia fulva]AVR45738.1 DNA-binding protein [Christiangramia fulva]
MKFKSHFALSRSQQNGIFILVIFIIILQIFIFFPNLLGNSEKISSEDPEIEKFRKQLDSLKSLKSLKSPKDTIYPFNPNYLSDFKAYNLGLNLEQTNRLLDFRAEQKWIKSAEDFQKVTGISDSLLHILAPSLRFPKWVEKSEKKYNISQKTAADETVAEISDLNSATPEDLKTINGVGEVLSQRIVKYRYKIGGFLDESQLNDVYGLTPEVVEKIRQRFKILIKPNVNKLNINTVSEDQLSEIPYFNERLAKKIIGYRKLHEGIQTFDELSKIDGFPSDKIDRIKLYLAIE